MLDRFGFDPYFREIFGSDFLFSKKEKIDHALEKYGIPREKAFYIGDTAGDIVEARAAGVRSVAVTWGWHDRERLVAVRPDFLIDTPEGLLTIDPVGACDCGEMYRPYQAGSLAISLRPARRQEL